MSIKCFILFSILRTMRAQAQAHIRLSAHLGTPVYEETPLLLKRTEIRQRSFKHRSVLHLLLHAFCIYSQWSCEAVETM